MKFPKNELTIIHGEYFSKCGTKWKLHIVVTKCVANPFEDAYIVHTHIKIICMYTNHQTQNLSKTLKQGDWMKIWMYQWWRDKNLPKKWHLLIWKLQIQAFFVDGNVMFILLTFFFNGHFKDIFIHCTWGYRKIGHTLHLMNLIARLHSLSFYT
jgi:hypothetical protein